VKYKKLPSQTPKNDSTGISLESCLRHIDSKMKKAFTKVID